MIIREGERHLEIIRQTDHARLAGQIASCWDEEYFWGPNPREEVLFAIAQHDNGWMEWEEAPVICPETGLPYPFTGMPAGDLLGIWSRGPHRFVAQHPYASLLLSLHGVYLLSNRYRHGLDDPLDREMIRVYLLEEKAFQRSLIKQLGLEEVPDKKVALLRNYRLLQLCDWLSLVVCCPIPSATLLDKVPLKEEGETTIYLHLAQDKDLEMKPFPLKKPLTTSVPVYRLPKKYYHNDDEFLEAWQNAEVKPLTVRFLEGKVFH